MKLDDIRELAIQIRDKAIAIGWSKEKAKALMRGARKYGGIENGLNSFRESIREYAGARIDRDLIELIKVYGTIEDKSLLIFLGAYDCRILSIDEAIEVRDYIEDHHSKEDMAKHLDMYYKYYSIKETMSFFKKNCLRYYSSAFALARNIAVYEDISRATKYLTQLLALVPDDKSKEAAEIMANYSLELEEDTTYGLFESDGERIIDKDAEELLTHIKEEAKGVIKDLEDFKSVYLAIEDWTKENGIEDFLPMEFREEKDKIEKYNGVVTISDKWLISYPDNKEKLGGTVTEEERQKAILPTFEEAKPTLQGYDFTKKKLNKLYDEIRNK